MLQIDQLANAAIRSDRRWLYLCGGLIVLLPAGLLGAWPGLIAMAAIGAATVGLMGAQHLIARLLTHASPAPLAMDREALDNRTPASRARWLS